MTVEQGSWLSSMSSTNVDGVLTVTAKTAGELTGTPALTGTGLTAITPTEGANKVDATNEAQTLDFGTALPTAGTYTVTYGGMNYSVVIAATDEKTGVTLDDVKSALSKALDIVVAITDTDDTKDNALTITAKGDAAGKDLVNIIFAKGEGEASGTDSTAHSDNTINGGADDDLLILGTGALSNDTVINFSTAGDGADKMDFSFFFGAGKMADTTTVIA